MFSLAANAVVSTEAMLVAEMPILAAIGSGLCPAVIARAHDFERGKAQVVDIAARVLFDLWDEHVHHSVHDIAPRNQAHYQELQAMNWMIATGSTPEEGIRASLRRFLMRVNPKKAINTKDDVLCALRDIVSLRERTEIDEVLPLYYVFARKLTIQEQQ